VFIDSRTSYLCLLRNYTDAPMSAPTDDGAIEWLAICQEATAHRRIETAIWTSILVVAVWGIGHCGRTR